MSEYMPKTKSVDVAKAPSAQTAPPELLTQSNSAALEEMVANFLE